MARDDAMIKINGLLSEHLGYTQSYRHAVPMADEGDADDDVLRDVELALNSAGVSRHFEMGLIRVN